MDETIQNSQDGSAAYSNPGVEPKPSILPLLNEARKTARQVYAWAITFLIAGLLVAAAGVFYFYFSNDALFLDRAFYEDQINALESERIKLKNDNRLLAKSVNDCNNVDKLNIDVLNKELSYNKEILASYVGLYNDVIRMLNVNNDPVKYIESKLDVHNSRINNYDKRLKSTYKLISNRNLADSTLNESLKKYSESFTKRPEVVKPVSSYDKPELVFSPKLVYGFVSRLGGLIFIEIIAFFLLKQYRVNMNDFKYYDHIARQTQANIYLIDHINKLDDEKNKIEIISKLFTYNQISVVDDKQDINIPFADVDSVKKLLEAIKDFVKK